MEHQSQIDELRRAWKEAIDDDSPGVSPEEVFTRLEKKYQALLEQARDDSGEL